jgi:hypothetical protein
MKKNLLTLAAVLSVNLILLSLAVPVNHSSQVRTHNAVVLVADGVPGPGLPPPPPPPTKMRPTDNWKSALS